MENCPESTYLLLATWVMVEGLDELAGNERERARERVCVYDEKDGGKETYVWR